MRDGVSRRLRTIRQVTENSTCVSLNMSWSGFVNDSHIHVSKAVAAQESLAEHVSQSIGPPCVCASEMSTRTADTGAVSIFVQPGFRDTNKVSLFMSLISRRLSAAVREGHHPSFARGRLAISAVSPDNCLPWRTAQFCNLSPHLTTWYCMLQGLSRKQGQDVQRSLTKTPVLSIASSNGPWSR